MNNEDYNLNIKIRNLIKELYNYLDVDSYLDDDKVEYIYEFLTKNNIYIFNYLLKEFDLSNPDLIKNYKNKIILTLCTDFYLDIDYKTNHCIYYSFYQRRAYDELIKYPTAKRILNFFKDPKNKYSARTIIKNFYNYAQKGSSYTNACMDNEIRNNKIFSLMQKNPIFIVDYYNFYHQEVIESEIIKVLISEIYEHLLEERINYEYDSKIDKKIDNNDKTPSFYAKLKRKITNQLIINYKERGEIHKVISYIVSRAYETMKINPTNSNKKIIEQIENNCEDIEHISKLFIDDYSFSTQILIEFINNRKISDKTIMRIRERHEVNERIKVLRKINTFYEKEKSKFQKKTDF